MIIAGIDPGVSGAIAILDGTELIATEDMPVLSTKTNKRMVNAAELADIIRHHRPTEVKLEQVGARPGQGVTSMFNFGQSYGVAQGVVAALGIPLTLVPPQVWKRRAGLGGADKDYARTKAQLLYPSADLARKKDIGRADAILIARYG